MNYNRSQEEDKMNRERAIPKGFMTVGELAKQMGTTVRTLQYYDREGLLCPTAQSEGGRRLYTYKDMVRLHQIQALKALGFSLDDIKTRLISLDTPQEVAEALTQQAQAIREKIGQLTETLSAVEALKEEVQKMQEVDFKKYADIVVNLQMHNEYYWLIKHFDDSMLDHIRERFDQGSGLRFIGKFHELTEQILECREKDLAPEDEKVQTLTAQFWGMVVEFTGGDMSLLPKLMEFGDLQDDHEDWSRKQALVNEYLQPALELYFQNSGINPFGEVQS